MEGDLLNDWLSSFKVQIGKPSNYLVIYYPIDWMGEGSLSVSHCSTIATYSTVVGRCSQRRFDSVSNTNSNSNTH